MKDITGVRFGRLVALRPTGTRKNSCVLWECRCDCGKTVFKESRRLKEGVIVSCGCLNKNDLTGQRFGKLVALRATEERRGSSVVWECQCDCGNTVLVRSSHLTGLNTKSCGCSYKHKVEEEIKNTDRIYSQSSVDQQIEEFNQINRAAKGMSYGQYIALLRAEKEKQSRENNGN